MKKAKVYWELRITNPYNKNKEHVYTKPTKKAAMAFWEEMKKTYWLWPMIASITKYTPGGTEVMEYKS